MTADLELTPVEFVALLNQTLEFAYPSVAIQGELANFRISKNRWVYFDLKDEEATVRFFGTVYNLPGPLQDGMLLKVRGQPRLHPQFGFSVSVQSITPAGQGSIKKAAALLQAKLTAEGLFDPARKRPLPYPPTRVGLITSAESAAYRDFIKVLQGRWGSVVITLIDVQVQGEPAPAQLVAAIAQFNQLPDPPEVMVITRGGGSAEDLQAFSAEQVTRAVASSRVPTLVAIGHEIDVSLAELAADCRASTPSNAAELLVPDRKAVLERLRERRHQLETLCRAQLDGERRWLADTRRVLHQQIVVRFHQTGQRLAEQKRLLEILQPQAALRRGYAIIRKNGNILQRGAALSIDDLLSLELIDANLQVRVQKVDRKG